MLRHHIRQSLRGFWHSKTFAIVAIACLGFGIGVNTTIFSVVDGVLLKPYPYPEPERILILRSFNRAAGTDEAGLSFPEVEDLKRSNRSFSAIAAETGRSVTITSPGAEPERYLASGVSWDLFPMLGAAPVVGQPFTAEHDRVGAPPVVLLGHDLWQGRYQGDRALIGQTIHINGRAHVVLGVMPPGFRFPTQQRLWVPLAQLAGRDGRDNRSLFVFGRLRDGVTEAEAGEDLERLAAGLARQHPASNQGWSLRLETLRAVFLPVEVPIVLVLMMVGATLVLFIACSNVANLLLARAATRQREIAVRTALGAGRGRIVGQLLIESVLLGGLSLPLGIGLAQVGTRLIAAAMPVDQVPYYITWEMDWRSLVYSAVIALGTAVLFGLVPALQASRGNLHEALKEGTRGNTASKSRVRSALVIVQVALALVALVGALLFVRTFRNLEVADVGFDVAPLMTLRVYMGGEPYEVPDARLRRIGEIVERIEALPQVEAAFASNFVPLSSGGGGGPVIVDGRPTPADAPPTIAFIGVTPGYARTLGLTPRRGRDFSRADASGRVHVALVNESMVREFWPGVDPIGRRFRMLDDSGAAPWFTVVGVVPDVNLYGVQPDNTQPPNVAYVPYAFQQTLNTGLTMRVRGAPSAVIPAVREIIRDIDASLPIAQVRTVEDARRLSYWQYGLYGWVFGTIGSVGLLLASFGVFGVLSYSVAQRTQEIGVRVALGAARGDVVALVLRYGLTLAGLGVVIGLALAPLLTVFGRSLFYDISPFDPITFGSVAVFLIGVAAVASYLPARRATRVNPVSALRGE